MSVSFIRRIASPKKALTTAAVAAATAGLALTAAPAQAATTSASSAQSIAHRMIPDAAQFKWGLDYMNSRYGSPVKAWDFWQANGWY